MLPPDALMAIDHEYGAPLPALAVSVRWPRGGTVVEGALMARFDGVSQIGGGVAAGRLEKPVGAVATTYASKPRFAAKNPLADSTRKNQVPADGRTKTASE